MIILKLLKSCVQAIIGISAANTLNNIHEKVDSEQRGKSPNQTSLKILQFAYALMASTTMIEVLTLFRWIRVTNLAVGLTFGLPALISIWPKNSNYDHFKNKTQNFTNNINNSFIKFIFLGLITNIFNLFVQKTPLIRWILKPSVKVVDLIDQHLTKIFLGLNIASYLGLFIMGSYVLAGSALFIYGLGILDRYNVLPSKVRDFMKKYLVPLTLFGNLFYGNFFEKFVSLTVILMSYTHHLGTFIVSLLKMLNMKKEFVAALQEQKRKVNAFDFQCEAKHFVESLQQLKTLPCDITRAHVLDNAMLIPPFFKETEIDELLPIFDSVPNWEAHETAIEDYKKKDWRAKAANDLDEESLFPSHLSKEELLVRHKAFMRGNIEIFLKRIKRNDLHAAKTGTQEILDRYTRAIIFYLKQYSSDSKELADKLIHLGFETGDYCTEGLLGVVENSYLSLTHLDKVPPLKRSVRTIHQFHRERFFQGYYLQEELYDLYWEEILLYPPHSKSSKIWRNDLNDRHAFAKAIGFWAPRLGLPALYFEYAADQDHPATAFWYSLLSARSEIERKFWKERTIESLKQEIRNGVNTSRLPLTSVQQWYDQFIDDHVMGTDAEKEALKELPFYTVEHHKILPENKFGSVEQEFQAIQSNPNAVKDCGTVPITKIKEEILHLMFLDFEVIHLKASENNKENTFRFQAQEVTKEMSLEASTENAPIVKIQTEISPEQLLTLNTLLQENPAAIIEDSPCTTVTSGLTAVLHFSEPALPAESSTPNPPEGLTLERPLPKLAS